VAVGEEATGCVADRSKSLGEKRASCLGFWPCSVARLRFGPCSWCHVPGKQVHVPEKPCLLFSYPPQVPDRVLTMVPNPTPDPDPNPAAGTRRALLE
jgi:hypothetical protein